MAWPSVCSLNISILTERMRERRKKGQICRQKGKARRKGGERTWEKNEDSVGHSVGSKSRLLCYPQDQIVGFCRHENISASAWTSAHKRVGTTLKNKWGRQWRVTPPFLGKVTPTARRGEGASLSPLLHTVGSQLCTDFSSCEASCFTSCFILMLFFVSVGDRRECIEGKLFWQIWGVASAPTWCPLRKSESRLF